MPLELTWVGEKDYPRVALTRMRCYGSAFNQSQKYNDSVTGDPRAHAGDFLLASRDGRDVGTLTSLSLVMWMRGTSLPTQGVAYVGTIKTERRKGKSPGGNSAGGNSGEAGIASQLMAESLRMARDRGEVVSALMPFRASFYEHFGYGLAEKRVSWTVPLALLPRNNFDGYRFFEDTDIPALVELRARECQQGQCDIETDAPTAKMWIKSTDNGLCYVDAVSGSTAIRGFAAVVDEMENEKRIARVVDWSTDSHESLVRLLSFLGSLRDQYSTAIISLPGDFPLNRLLAESQLPHRPVDHLYARAKPYTRMQIRILDHAKVLGAIRWPSSANGSAVIAVRETEGAISKFKLDVHAGRATVSPTNASANIELTDITWASIVSGDLDAHTARRFDLLQTHDDDAVALLQHLSVGRAPFCNEYF